MVYALPRDEGALFSHSKNKYQMKKRRLRVVTIAALLAALFGSGGGTAWGQTVPDCNNDYGADEWAKISTSVGTSPFYPLTPTTGIPWNSSGVFSGPTGAPNTWSSNVAVAVGTIGRITLGGNQKKNVIYNIRNYATGGIYIETPTPGGSPCSDTGYDSYGNSVSTPGPVGRCSGAEYDYIANSGNGMRSQPNNGILNVANNFYNRETQVRILGNTSAGAWVEMDHILMEDIEWWYRRHVISWSNKNVIRNWSYWCSSPPGGCSCGSQNFNQIGSFATVSSTTVKGGNVDGHVILDAGATVSLTSDIIGIRNAAHGTSYPGGGAATGSLLDLPANDPYTLQVRAMFEASTFNGGADIHGFPNLAPQAVLGLWTGIDKDVNTNNTDGGTFLIGNATQNQIKLTLNSGANGGTLANYYYHTNTEERPSGVWNNASVTKTKAPAPSHAVNISGSSSGTDIKFRLNGAGDMTIENTQCDSLNFNGKFAPTIGGDGALRINPRTWTTTGNLEYPTVFSPIDLPPVLPTPTGSAVRGHTHFAEDVDLNFTTKTGFLLLEGGKITFDKKYTYNRGGVSSVTGQPNASIGSHQVVMALGGCDTGHIRAYGDVSSVSGSQLPVLWWANENIET